MRGKNVGFPHSLDNRNLIPSRAGERERKRREELLKKTSHDFQSEKAADGTFCEECDQLVEEEVGRLIVLLVDFHNCRLSPVCLLTVALPSIRPVLT